MHMHALLLMRSFNYVDLPPTPFAGDIFGVKPPDLFGFPITDRWTDSIQISHFEQTISQSDVVEL